MFSQPDHCLECRTVFYIQGNGIFAFSKSKLIWQAEWFILRLISIVSPKGKKEGEKTILTWHGDGRGAFNATDVGKLYSVCKIESDAFQKGVVESVMWNYRYSLTSKRHAPGRMWQRMWQVLEMDLVSARGSAT